MINLTDANQEFNISLDKIKSDEKTGSSNPIEVKNEYMPFDMRYYEPEKYCAQNVKEKMLKIKNQWLSFCEKLSSTSSEKEVAALTCDFRQ